MLDLDAYFARIGYAGPRAPTLETLRGLTAAHATAIPFENLDVLLGRPIALEPEALFDKLVARRRGGYCFEQNGLLLRVLEELGFSVRPLSARVRIDRPRAETPPRTHVFLQVTLGGQRWLTDVGVGALSLTAPVRFGVEGEQATPHEPRRLVREGDLWFHQARLGVVWSDVYEFTGEEMPRVDREVGNWFTSAHPASHFRGRLMVARAAPDGRRLALVNGELKLRARDGRAETRPVGSPEALLEVLASEFGLVFPPETRFGPPGSPWPR
ncbi:MAG TPA: arylamine N-acetyltransferase [Polyangia bacterium]|nr:arylamine N-acetyltransferase [Polyangia bacterium]